MKRRFVAAVLLGLAMAIAAGCGAAAQTAPKIAHKVPAIRHRPQNLTCDAACIAHQPALDAAANYAETVAGAAHVLAGDRVDDAANKTIVYLVHAPQSVLAQLQSRHPGTYVIHNDAPRTLHEVVTLQKSMDWQAWKTRRIKIVSSGPTGTGYLVVGVSTSVAKAQAAFDATYGGGIIRAVHGEPIEQGCACGPVGKPSR